MIALAVLSASLMAAQTPERRCEASHTPRQLPAVGALLDSARVVADLTGGAAPAGGVGLLFSLIYNDEDSLPETRGLDSAASAAADLLARSVRPLRPKESWGVRVRVVAGAAPAVTLERSLYCPPLPRSVQARPRRLVATMGVGDRNRSLGTTVRFIVDAEISETGDVEGLALVRPTGVREIDEEILRLIRIRPFLPALLDGTPVPSRIQVRGQTHKVGERLSDFGVQVEFSISMSL